MRLFPRRWRKDPDALDRAKQADDEARKHVERAQGLLEQAARHYEEVQAKWPAALENSRRREQLMKTNSLTKRFLNELHGGQAT